MAAIHERLRADCLLLGRFPLCHLLLMQDANYPWFILVPDREGIGEIYQLTESDRAQLMQESVQLSRALVAAFSPDKLNIAALGNVVPQLHVHHIARFRHDAAWPAPVWGRAGPVRYTDERLAEVLELLKQKLPTGFEWQPELR